jgi:integrase
VSEIIDQFAEAYFPQQNMSERRRGQVRRQLTEFEAMLDGRPLLEATGLDLERFLSVRLESFAPTTVRKQQYEIRPFFKWAHRHRLITDEQYRSITAVPGPRGGHPSVHKPNPYSRDDLRRLWALLDRRFPYAERKWVDRYLAGKSPWSRVRRHAERLQYEAMIACALYGGLRAGEVWRLRLDDLHDDHAVLAPKTRKNDAGVWVTRKVPIIDPMREAFNAWHEFRTGMAELGVVSAEPDEPWIRLDHRGLGGMLRAPNRTGRADAHLTRIGHDGKLHWGFHRLRHTCATEMLRAGYKLHIVRKIMGHSSLEQTLRYAELLDADVLAESDRVGGRFARSIAGTFSRNGAEPVG